MTNRQIIYDLISKSERPLTEHQICYKTGIHSDYVGKYLLDLWCDCKIKKGRVPFIGWVTTHGEEKN